MNFAGMRAESPFSRSSILFLIACATALFALSILLHARGKDASSSGSRSLPGTYSVSAIGYAGFYDLMQRLDRPAVRAVRNTLATVGARGTLVVAEPDMRFVTDAESRRLMEAPRLLVVLPKWLGAPDEKRASWISAAEPVPLFAVRQTLGLVATARSDVFRADWPKKWRTNRVGIAPEGSGIAQLMRSEEMNPIVGDEDGMLVGEIMDGERRIWVLSDPDVLANHGIVKGDNAAFMVALVDMLRLSPGGDASAPVVFDETVHGFQAGEASPLQLLFRFPFVVVTLLVCCTAALLLAAGTGRFGAPLVPKPALDFGKESLTRNAAHLLDYAGYHTAVLRRYVNMTIRSAAGALHLPPGLGEAETAERLDRIGRARQVKASCAAIRREASQLEVTKKKELARLFEYAWDIYDWKGELLNGSGTHRRHRQDDQG